MKKFFFVFFLLHIAYCLLPTVLCADGKFQLTGQLSPSYETMTPRNRAYKGLYGYKLSYNFGFEYKDFLSPVFSYSIGLQFQNKGFKNTLHFVSSDSVTVFKDGALVINAYYLMAPVDLNWNIRIFNKTELVLSTGLSLGYLLRQEMVGRRIPAELVQHEINPITGEPLDPGVTKIDWFKHFYAGWNVGCGVTQYVKSKLVIVVQPMYTRQINTLVDPFGPLRNADLVLPKFDSFALHIRIGYYFNDQIENYKKEF